MTGMLKATAIGKLQEVRKAIGRVDTSLGSLQNLDSDYAREHEALLEAYERVESVWSKVLVTLADSQG